MSKITKSARGQACMIRIPGYCSFNSEETVFAHMNGGGMGKKNIDLLGSYSCANCHDIVDGRFTPTGMSRDEIKLCFYEGIFRTQQILYDEGLIVVK